MAPLNRQAADAAGRLKRFLYRDGRPGRVMRWANRFDAWLYARGVSRVPQAAVLRVPGRRSGQPTTVPIAVADLDGADYLVSMLGREANWVRNIEANARRATLIRHGDEQPVRLEEVPAGERAPILRRYAAVAPGARPHLGLGPKASLDEFARIAAEHPVYRVLGDPVSSR
ncbi:nitroreductase family deazaflavin-dependent oxidoreductase [Gordonia paraffinivorans]|uniref:nitroreductase/quinone reductase family protein n=1 Tax=Gordonia paraffinivorans TaxID=175628 RepID=UPI000D622B22|nr:nitroreductase/quinone reductase family protein [Gordonia paraffinivorans]MBY4574553.1 nitroreductase family deazaflavin-dependent oxidoreductase [Gordonia paraffinivorans]PWD41164.1 nitroreductase family deazaflavin-dependent oxidoreductase [Gordonia paraffinivorans]